jgi:glycosyltransferase involved in cell wall biosynthesis
MILFSFIIPTYNRATFITKTIKSLLDQSYSNFEIIIVDDGSTDNTEEVINLIKDPRVRYFKKENGERGAARNYGTDKALGRYCNFFDSDDLAYPNHLQEAYNLIKEHDQEPEVFHLLYDLKKPNGELLEKASFRGSPVNKLLIFENFLSCNGVFIRTDIAEKFRFPEDRRIAVSEDWALWLRLASRYTILNKNIITSSIVIHDQRSIYDYSVDKVIIRDELLLEYLFSDKEFLNYFRKNLDRFKSDRYTFFTLLLSLKKRRKETIHYLLKAMKTDPTVVIRRRFLASVKKLITVR